MNRKSPVYLNALRAFEASGCHDSFSGTADELGVTAAVVGRLVRNLEEWLGMSPMDFSVLIGVRPISETMPLERAAEGVQKMRCGAVKFRMVLITGDRSNAHQ